MAVVAAVAAAVVAEAAGVENATAVAGAYVADEAVELPGYVAAAAASAALFLLDDRVCSKQLRVPVEHCVRIASEGESP